MLRSVVTVLSFAIAGAAWADVPPIPGQDEPAFLEAKAAWLDGDDLPALKSLKVLAESGNTAAQILFARIAEEPHMHRHVTGNLTRKDKNVFLRQPGGISGTSWLEAAKGESDLASALLLSKQAFTIEKRDGGSLYSPEAEEAVLGFLIFGERDLATEAVFKLYDGNFLRPALELLTRYQADLDPIAEPIRVSLEAVNAVIYASEEESLSAVEIYSKYSERMDAIAPEVQLGSARMKIAQVVFDESRQAEIKQYAERVRAWKPLAQLCETSCPTSYSDCLLAGAISIGPTSRFPFSSPAQSLIPTDTYWSSARIRSDTARRLAEVDQYFEYGASIDQCFAETVTALAQ